MHTASIQELCTSHYTAGEIREWTNQLTPERYISAMGTFEFLLAEVEDKIQGFCVLDLDNAELNALYVAPWAVRKGTGKALMSVAEEMARKQGLIQLSVRATLNSVSFYEAVGYVRLEPSIHPLPSGLALPCVRLKKMLPPAKSV